MKKTDIENEKKRISNAYELTQEVKRAAELIGYSRCKFYNFMHKHGGKFAIKWEKKGGE